MGLGDKEEDADFYLASSCTSLYKNRIKWACDVEKVHLTTIDNFVNINKLQVGIIKADIEGAEMKLLEGAKNTIFEQKPALIISIYHSAKDFFEIKPMIESWNLGYRFKISEPMLPGFVGETCLLAEVPKE